MSKRRERESYSSLSSLESSPNPKNLKMMDEDGGHVGEVSTLTAIYEMMVKVQENTKEIMKENLDFRNEMLVLKKESAAHAESIAKLQTENASLRRELKSHVNHVEQLQSTISMQEELLDDVRQYQRKYNVEIHGVPEIDGEDLEEIVEEIAKETKVEIVASDIDIIHRQKSKITPRPILVKFKCYEDKQSFYNARRKLKNFKGDDVKVNGASKIYINEHLTADRKKLFAEVRKRARQYKWYRVTTNDGKIFIKTSKEDRPTMVTKEADLEGIYGY